VSRAPARPAGLGRLSVRVDAAPRPALLRPASEARLAGRAVGPGPERAVADAVAAALARGGPDAARRIP
jgi:hypothetical protein